MKFEMYLLKKLCNINTNNTVFLSCLSYFFTFLFLAVLNSKICNLQRVDIKRYISRVLITADEKVWLIIHQTSEQLSSLFRILKTKKCKKNNGWSWDSETHVFMKISHFSCLKHTNSELNGLNLAHTVSFWVVVLIFLFFLRQHIPPNVK